MDVEFEIAELKRRVSALETNDATMAEDIAVLKRDMRRVVLLQEDMIASLEALNRRVAALELRINGIEQKMADFRSDVDQIKTEFASFRRELPRMIAETMREVLAEARGA